MIESKEKYSWNVTIKYLLCVSHTLLAHGYRQFSFYVLSYIIFKDFDESTVPKCVVKDPIIGIQ